MACICFYFIFKSAAGLHANTIGACNGGAAGGRGLFCGDSGAPGGALERGGREVEVMPVLGF